MTASTTKRRRLDVDDLERDEDRETPPWTRRSKREDEEPVAEEETGSEEAGEEESIVPVARGRKAINSKRQNSDSSAYFRWPETDGEPVVVKFLDEEPWSYNQHWVQERATGRKSFPCIGEDCPLCEIGIQARQKIVYSLVNLSSKDGPTVQTWEVAPTLDDVLLHHDQDVKTGPLSRMFWALARTKGARSSSFAKYNYTFTPIKQRDLEEDWGIDPAKIADAIDKAEAPDPSKVLGKVTRRQLQEIADEVMER